MNTGDRLVDLSTLSTGTAMDHFLNIAIGSGIINVICPYYMSYTPLMTKYLTYELAQGTLDIQYNANDTPLITQYIQSSTYSIVYNQETQHIGYDPCK